MLLAAAQLKSRVSDVALNSSYFAERAAKL